MSPDLIYFVQFQLHDYAAVDGSDLDLRWFLSLTSFYGAVSLPPNCVMSSRFPVLFSTCWCIFIICDPTCSVSPADLLPASKVGIAASSLLYQTPLLVFSAGACWMSMGVKCGDVLVQWYPLASFLFFVFLLFHFAPFFCFAPLYFCSRMSSCTWVCV